MINQGLAVRVEKGIDIACSATHEEIVDTLSIHLPGPMAYFADLGLTIFGDFVSAPGWVLMSREKQRLRVVQVVNPAGKDLETHLGPNNSIYIGELVDSATNSRNSPTVSCTRHNPTK